MIREAFKPKRKTIDIVQEWRASGHQTANWLSPKRWQAAKDFLPEPIQKAPRFLFKGES